MVQNLSLTAMKNYFCGNLAREELLNCRNQAGETFSDHWKNIYPCSKDSKICQGTWLLKGLVLFYDSLLNIHQLFLQIFFFVAFYNIHGSDTLNGFQIERFLKSEYCYAWYRVGKWDPKFRTTQTPKVLPTTQQSSTLKRRQPKEHVKQKDMVAYFLPFGTFVSSFQRRKLPQLSVC